MIEMIIIIVAIILFAVLLIRSRETEEGTAEEKKEVKKEKKEKGTLWSIGTLLLGVIIWTTAVILGFFLKILFGDKD